MAINRSLVETASILEKHINLVKYVVFCVNVIVWILGAFLLGMALALRYDTELEEWIETLNIWEFYIGDYVLIFAGLLVILVPVFSCVAVYQEISQLLLINAAVNAACFLLLMIGCGIILENSSSSSGVRDTIRESMSQLIAYSYNTEISHKLNMIQEQVGCCGAEGANDYFSLRKPLPNECRDTVTGNAYFHGCADEITWFLEDKASWLTGMAMTAGALNLFVTVLSYILIQALQKEEKLTYRR